MAAWMPCDGSQHEGPGYGSCTGALGIAFQVSDELIGTSYLKSPFYQAAAPYTLQVSAPGGTNPCTSPIALRSPAPFIRSS